MKKITFSADETLIKQARLVAKSQRKTLNAAFREWLKQFTVGARCLQKFDSLMKRLAHVRAGRHFKSQKVLVNGVPL